LNVQSAELAFLRWCREIRERSRDVWIRRKLYETGIDFGPVTEAIDLVVLVEVACFKVGAFSEEILSRWIELFPWHSNRIRTYIGIPEKDEITLQILTLLKLRPRRFFTQMNPK